MGAYQATDHRVVHWMVDCNVNNHSQLRLFTSLSVLMEGTPKQPPCQEGTLSITGLAARTSTGSDCIRPGSMKSVSRTDMMHKVEQHRPTAARHLGHVTGALKAAVLRCSTSHIDAKRASILSFLVRAKIEIDLKYALLNGCHLNFLAKKTFYAVICFNACQYSFKDTYAENLKINSKKSLPSNKTALKVDKTQENLNLVHLARMLQKSKQKWIMQSARAG